MTVLHIDFETRSTVDLKAAGLDNYASHSTTDVWCMGYTFGDEAVGVVTPENANAEAHVLGGDTGMYDVLNHVRDGGIVAAHNAAFELAIWNKIMVPRYGWPALKPEQVRCTMAMAYAMALPGSLENAAAAVGIPHQKDKAGYRLMMQMCRPRSFLNPAPNEGPAPVAPEPVWWDEPEKKAALYEYCKQDVRVERELDKRLMQLSADEQSLWVLDQTINARGVYVDREAVQAAIAIVQTEQARLDAEMRRVTGNFVGFCTEVARLTKWVNSQGVQAEGLAKADILDLLENEDILPEAVVAALKLRREAGKTSTAKLRTMLEASSSDGRLRGMLQYHGAGTGRWAGRKVQLHNIPRPSIKQHEVEEVFTVLEGVQCSA